MLQTGRLVTIMATRKRSKRITGAKTRAARTVKMRDRNGKIELERCTLRELKAYAASTQFSVNRAIMRAAIRSLEALDIDPKEAVCRVTFGLMPSPKQPLSGGPEG
jgi:hypothetical protein